MAKAFTLSMILLKLLFLSPPGLAGQMFVPAKPEDVIPAVPKDNSLKINIGGLTRALDEDRDMFTSLNPVTFDPNALAFVRLGKRCKQAAQIVQDKLFKTIPFTEESDYLTKLKKVLDEGATNAAEAVRKVRELSGTELPVVLAELGVSSSE
ncbi:MAG: hypothetical protein HQL14_08680 [Candidatus Omnitrophica bacterium]|nr:hypothetical protein [Candidatus Omnitrophota bacterium]